MNVKLSQVVSYHSDCDTQPMAMMLYADSTDNTITADFTSINCTTAIIYVYDMYGHKVMNRFDVKTTPGENVQSINVSLLPAGVYFVRVYSDCNDQKANFMKVN